MYHVLFSLYMITIEKCAVHWLVCDWYVADFATVLYLQIPTSCYQRKRGYAFHEIHLT